MIRKLDRATTLEQLEDHCQYTVSALQADPDAADLVSYAETWFTRLDELRSIDRMLRVGISAALARRTLAVERLKRAVMRFGLDLLAAVGGNRTAIRYTQFFPVSPSQLGRQAQAELVATVKTWLSALSDPVLEAHRSTLEQWANTCATALDEVRVAGSKRAELWLRRETLCDQLTDERDALYQALAQRARERDLLRDWPDLFFLRVRGVEKAAEDGAMAERSTGALTSEKLAS